MAKNLEYRVTCEKPDTGRIFTEVLSWEDYDSPSDLREAVKTFCNEAVKLGWDVLALDDDSAVVFTFKQGAIS